MNKIDNTTVEIKQIQQKMQHYFQTHWGFVLFSGVTALILAVVVWMGWPGTAEWLLGLIFGINMFFGGWSLVNISLRYKESQ